MTLYITIRRVDVHLSRIVNASGWKYLGTVTDVSNFSYLVQNVCHGIYDLN